jgi:hypothetical protein
MLSLVLLDEDDQEKVERIDCEDDDDIDEENEDEVTAVEVVVPRSRTSSTATETTTPASTNTNTRHNSSAVLSSSGRLDSLQSIHTIAQPVGVGLGYATKAANQSATIVLRPGEKYMQENKHWWDTLLNFNKAKKSVYGTHGTKINQLNLAGA